MRRERLRHALVADVAAPLERLASSRFRELTRVSTDHPPYRRLPWWRSSGASPLPYEWYKVVEGDTLSLIAERMLGDLWRWPDLHALNQAIIGPDPDHIEAGIEIRLPRK